jgi:hypothetical protein
MDRARAAFVQVSEMQLGAVALVLLKTVFRKLRALVSGATAMAPAPSGRLVRQFFPSRVSATMPDTDTASGLPMATSVRSLEAWTPSLGHVIMALGAAGRTVKATFGSPRINAGASATASVLRNASNEPPLVH